MKRFGNFNGTPTRTASPTVAIQDESLVSDVRAGLRPAQMVESRLVNLLNNSPLPVNRLQNSAKKHSVSI